MTTVDLIDAIAGEPHFLDHLAPVWHALPAEHRGTFWVMPELIERADGHGITARPLGPSGKAPLHVGRVTVVASIGDYVRAPGRRRALAQHGAGQSYSSRHPSYAGGVGAGDAHLFLVPNRHAARRYAQRYPKIPVDVVGCPKLDRPPARAPRGPRPVVAVSFHWHAPRLPCPEVGSAWPELGPAILAELVAAQAAGRIDVIGHGHPKAWPELEPAYVAAGIEPVADFDEVLARADVYAVDNSSTLYEFAALVGPVVVINAPAYRRTVRHGLRFWDAADVGPQVDHPAELLDAITEALEDSPERQRLRARALAAAYAHLDGTASRRAAMALVTSMTATGRCPICQTASCACGGPTGTEEQPTMTKATKGPVRIYRTARGDFRLNERDAKRRGLIPDGDRWPAEVERRLRKMGMPPEERAAMRERYADELDAEQRAAFLAEFALVNDRQLRDGIRELRLERAYADAVVDDDPGATEPGPAAPPPPAEEEPPAGTVGAVVVWVDEAEGPARVERARRALIREAATEHPRVTLIEALQGIIDEADDDDADDDDDEDPKDPEA